MRRGDRLGPPGAHAEEPVHLAGARRDDPPGAARGRTRARALPAGARLLRQARWVPRARRRDRRDDRQAIASGRAGRPPQGRDQRLPARLRRAGRWCRSSACPAPTAPTLRDALFARRAASSSTPTLAALVDQAPPSTLEFLRAWVGAAVLRRAARGVAACCASTTRPGRGAPYPPVFVTVDAVVRCAGRVLLIRRGARAGQGPVRRARRLHRAARDGLPVGPARAGARRRTWRCSTTTMRRCLQAVAVFDHPDRSQRGRTITHAHYFDLGDRELPEVRGGDDARSRRVGADRRAAGAGRPLPRRPLPHARPLPAADERRPRALTRHPTVAGLCSATPALQNPGPTMDAPRFATTKIQPPRSRAVRVERPPLDAAVTEALLDCRVVLLQAPGRLRQDLRAGRAAGAACRPAPRWPGSRWTRTTTPRRLFACLAAALEPHDLPWRTSPEALVAQLVDDGATLRRAVAELVNALAGAEAPRGVIVLDDLHRVGAAPTARAARRADRAAAGQVDAGAVDAASRRRWRWPGCAWPASWPSSRRTTCASTPARPPRWPAPRRRSAARERVDELFERTAGLAGRAAAVPGRAAHAARQRPADRRATAAPHGPPPVRLPRHRGARRHAARRCTTSCCAARCCPS